MSMRPCASLLGLAVILGLLLPFAKAEPPPARETGKDEAGWKGLFDKKSLDGWKSADFYSPGKVQVKDEMIVMEKGKKLTGVTYARDNFPKMDYEVTFEGKKIAGDDFFCTTTFRVGDAFCSLVVGGWGGSVVGLSSIDGADASENETRKDREFKDDQWYRIRIRVSKNRIESWIDKEKVVDLDTTDRKISIRAECIFCKPFGICTYDTTGAVRDIRVRTLTEADKKAIAETKPETEERLPRLFIVGDSTVKNGTKGQMGWGDPVVKLFDPAKIKVENRAIGGRSSRTFQTEGRWDRILAAAQKGDFVLIQMGHNDGGPLDDASRARGTIRGIGDEMKEIDNPLTGKKEVVHTYGWYLRKYVADARAKEMTPILLAPIPHCPKQPVEKGNVEKNGYVTWSEEVAKAEKVPFVNLNRLVMAHYVGMAPADVKMKYFTPADDTHTSPDGAELNAAAVVEGLRALKDCPLKDYLLPEKK
jgi:rhamnogalacturonan acetylesterase